MSLRIVVFGVLGLFIFYSFILSPLIKIIISLSGLKKIKNNISSLGKCLITFDNVFGSKFQYLNITFFVLTIVISILSGRYYLLVFSIWFILLFLNFLTINNYSKYNGVYERGLIKNTICHWESIFSWKQINNNTISFLKKDGLRFDLSFNDNLEEIKKILHARNIAEEN